MRFNPGEEVAIREATGIVVRDEGSKVIVRVTSGLGTGLEQPWHRGTTDDPVLTKPRIAEQKTIDATDPNVAEDDRPRLGRQSDEILQRLSEGPATGPELMQIAHRFGARIKDLRASGYQINAERLSGGQWKYTLNDSRVS